MVVDRARFREEAHLVTATYHRVGAGPAAPAHGPRFLRIIERNFLVYRNAWAVFLTGTIEPILYLSSIGVGVSRLVDSFTLADGTVVSYIDFVAPAMLATSAMNGVLYDTTFNIFFRMKYEKLYDTMLATPLRPSDIARGELIWALLRANFYSIVFILVMLVWGLVHSWAMLLALPVTVLIGFGFGGAGMALTTWMRSWQDFQFIQLAIMPMFLFSGTFYPVGSAPTAVQWVIRATPLYHGVELCRGCTLGTLGWSSLGSVAYLGAMGTIGLVVGSRRIGFLLLK
jgi:lipooligosaccharide transport system permease protein